MVGTKYETNPKLNAAVASCGTRRSLSWIAMKLSIPILNFVATALMTGCAGISASGPYPSTDTHTVDLRWTASTSPDVSGYNIYRAVYTDSCGSFSKINSALITNLWYTDSEVLNGAAYCYAATAVDTSNRESTLSDIVSNVHIPAA